MLAEGHVQVGVLGQAMGESPKLPDLTLVAGRRSNLDYTIPLDPGTHQTLDPFERFPRRQGDHRSGHTRNATFVSSSPRLVGGADSVPCCRRGHWQSEELAVPLNAEQRRARARLAANSRHHPDQPELTAEDAAGLEQATLDRHIDALVARAGRMTPEQADRLRRLFQYGPPPTPG